MSIKLIRIDDRLIHGQVASSWLRHVDAQQVICIDDKAAGNPIQKQVLKMAAPDLKVHVFSINQFIKIYNDQPIRRSTFMLITSTSDALRLKNGGIPVEYLNYGGMRKRDDRKFYDHDLCFSAEEESDLEQLLNENVKIEYQIAAYDQPVSIVEKIKEAKYKNEQN